MRRVTAPQLWLGGSFDPVHLGHLQLASQLADGLRARVWLLPCGVPAFGKQLAGADHRLAMLRLALGEFPTLRLDCRELERKGVSFTIDTLRTLRKERGETAHLSFVMGEDSLAHLDKWKDYQQLLQYVHLLILARTAPEIQPLPDKVRRLITACRVDQQGWRRSIAGTVFYWHNQYIDTASTQVRELAANRRFDQLQPLVSKSVFRYICEDRPY